MKIILHQVHNRGVQNVLAINNTSNEETIIHLQMARIAASLEKTITTRN